MTLKEIVEGNDYPCIVYRTKTTLSDGTTDDIYLGECSYINGELKGFDGDNYYLDDEIVEHKFTNDGGLTVWIEATLKPAGEYFRELREEISKTTTDKYLKIRKLLKDINLDAMGVQRKCELLQEIYDVVVDPPSKTQ